MRKKPCCYPCHLILTISVPPLTSGLPPQFRVKIETNTYSVPHRYAGAKLSLRIYPDRICIYHEQNLIARHVCRYDRHKDYEDPDHAKGLIEHRTKARDQKLFMRFLSLSSKAQDYHNDNRKITHLDGRKFPHPGQGFLLGLGARPVPR